jgi:hypothetical protein
MDTNMTHYGDNLEKVMRDKAEKKVLDYLAKRMFKEATMAVAEYETKQALPRGMGIDWKHYNPKRDIEILTNIFGTKPEILTKLDDSKLEYLRIGAAMMLLWGVNTPEKWLPDDFETNLTMDSEGVARMLLFKSQNAETKKQYKDSGVVQYVEILATPESCDSCKKLEGKRYKLSEAPELPNPYCTHEMGCRCVYLPCVD